MQRVVRRRVIDNVGNDRRQYRHAIDVLDIPGLHASSRGLRDLAKPWSNFIVAVDESVHIRGNGRFLPRHRGTGPRDIDDDAVVDNESEIGLTAVLERPELERLYILGSEMDRQHQRDGE